MLQYVLETGAGWKGPIKQAYIIMRLPYLANTRNVNNQGTTPGYQTLYNEIFWSYQNLEPTPNDNITIVFFEPRAWMKIQSLENQVATTPTDVIAWSELFDKYDAGEPPYHLDKASSFEKAIQANPDHAEFYARYAKFLCCLPRDKANQHVMPMINQALALDPQNKIALDVLASLHQYFPDLTYIPPSTIPPTPTPLVSSTPTATPPPSVTPIPSSTAQVVRKVVVQTRIVTVTPINTATPLPKFTLATSLPEASVTQNSFLGLDWLVGLLLLAVGFAGGILLPRKKA